MEIKFCERDDCRTIAVGTGIRPVRWCRPHYVEEHGAEFVQCKVTVDDPGLAVACARTGADIPRGGVVWLDPVETQIIGLVYAGIVEVIQDQPTPRAKAKG